MTWWNRYTAGPVPYAPHGRTMDGCDCWGLVRLVLAREFGVDLPSHADECADPCDRRQAAGAIARHILEWTPVPLRRARSGDAVALTIGGLVCHVGVVTEPGFMLHITRGIDASVERYTSLAWAKRLEGVYRWKA